MAMPGTDRGYLLRLRYAVSGTDIGRRFEELWTFDTRNIEWHQPGTTALDRFLCTSFAESDILLRRVQYFLHIGSYPPATSRSVLS
eukprot:1317728-Rhodomonas_salina.2